MSFVHKIPVPSFSLTDLSLVDSVGCLFIYILHKLILPKQIQFQSRFDYKLYLLRNLLLVAQLCVAVLIYRSNTYVVAIYLTVIIQLIPNLYKLIICKQKIQKFIYIGADMPNKNLAKLGKVINQFDFMVPISHIQKYLLKQTHMIVLNNPTPAYLSTILKSIPEIKIRLYQNNTQLIKPTIIDLLNEVRLPQIGYPKLRNVVIYDSCSLQNYNSKSKFTYTKDLKYLQRDSGGVIDISLLNYNCKPNHLHQLIEYAKQYRAHFFVMVPVIFIAKLTAYKKQIEQLSNIHIIQVPYFISNNKCITSLMQQSSNAILVCNRKELTEYYKYILGLGKRCPKYLELLYGDLIDLRNIKPILADLS